jgi:hypothetical protein
LVIKFNCNSNKMHGETMKIIEHNLINWRLLHFSDVFGHHRADFITKYWKGPPLTVNTLQYIKFILLFNTGCFKKSFTTLNAYRNLYRGHTQRFELSKCSKTHRVLPRIVIRNCFDLFFRFLLYGTSTVTPTPKSNGPYRSHNNDHYAHD